MTHARPDQPPDQCMMIHLTNNFLYGSLTVAVRCHGNQGREEMTSPCFFCHLARDAQSIPLVPCAITSHINILNAFETQILHKDKYMNSVQDRLSKQSQAKILTCFVTVNKGNTWIYGIYGVKVRVKVHFSLKHVTKSQRVNTGISQFFSLNSGLKVCGWSEPRHGLLYHRLDNNPCRKLGGIQGRSGRIRKTNPTYEIVQMSLL